VVDTGPKAVYCYRLARRRTAGKTGRLVKTSLWSAILTDIQFWVPVVVLAFGAGLLLSLR
jgi:hypothetical protein